ncbi:hypothetical protein BOTNAR_0259g00020 [Botryotinia narcissicola]|uniref:Uncharacterized protein n=1 Tax=Botryotinia narcissicola TaxID=278944 RepID=A0A4Z1HZQ4_9HELO|nr:hypothetical protein BOTNAR_0259g00020 [Botryotinia narcissicola]
MNCENTVCILWLLRSFPRISRASRRYREKGTGRGSTRRVVGKGYEDEVEFKVGGLRSRVTSVMQARRRTRDADESPNKV